MVEMILHGWQGLILGLLLLGHGISQTVATWGHGHGCLASAGITSENWKKTVCLQYFLIFFSWLASILYIYLINLFKMTHNEPNHHTCFNTHSFSVAACLLYRPTITVNKPHYSRNVDIQNSSSPRVQLFDLHLVLKKKTVQGTTIFFGMGGGHEFPKVPRQYCCDPPYLMIKNFMTPSRSYNVEETCNPQWA